MDSPDRRPIDPEDVERIRREMPTARDAVLVSLLAYAGLRPEEALALRWRDAEGGMLRVDRIFSSGELCRRTKSGPGRSVPIIAPLAEDLEALRRTSPGPLTS